MVRSERRVAIVEREEGKIFRVCREADMAAHSSNSDSREGKKIHVNSRPGFRLRPL